MIRHSFCCCQFFHEAQNSASYKNIPVVKRWHLTYAKFLTFSAAKLAVLDYIPSKWRFPSQNGSFFLPKLLNLPPFGVLFHILLFYPPPPATLTVHMYDYIHNIISKTYVNMFFTWLRRFFAIWMRAEFLLAYQGSWSAT